MRLRASLPVAFTLALAATALVGCGALDDEAGDDASVTIAAAFYPLAYVSERVGGEHASVDLLTQPGGEAHDLELGVQQTGLIASADLVVFEGGFQPAVDDAVEENATGESLDAAEEVDLLAVGESEDEHDDHADDEDEHADEAEDDHADEQDEHADEAEDDHADEQDEHADDDDHADDEDDHGHDHGDEDPHFWHDPIRMATLADAVADRLAEIDPDHAEDYRTNAADLRADLEALDTEFATGLAECERDIVVVAHDAFSYLEKYDIHLAPIAGLSPDAEPSPAHRAELQDLIRTEGLTTVFAERLGSSKLSESLAGDLGIETDILDPIEGLADETSNEDYLSLMEQNLEALRAANGCR